MDDNQLKKVSVVGSVISLIALYVFVLFIIPESINICDISLEHTGKIVNVTGTINDFRITEGNAFFTLTEDGCEINVVLWKNIIEGMELRGTNVSSLEENMTINLAGEVDVHSGYLQIVPTRPNIKLIS